MHQNVENVLERDRKLGDLEERADALQDGCAQFEKQAAAMKNKFWMENLKAIIAGSVVGLLVLGLIYWKFFMPQPPPPGYGPPAGYAPPPQAPVENAPEAGDGGEMPRQEVMLVVGTRVLLMLLEMMVAQNNQAIIKIDSIQGGKEDQDPLEHFHQNLPNFFCDTCC